MKGNQIYYAVIQYKDELPIKLFNDEKEALRLVNKLNQKNRIAFYQELDGYLLSFIANQHSLESVNEIFDLNRFVEEEGN